MAALATHKIDTDAWRDHVPPVAKLRLQVQGQPPGKTVFVANLNGNTVQWTWKGFTQEVAESSEPSPMVQILDGETVVFTWQAPYNADRVYEMADGRQPWMDGSISIHYSPDGQYTVFLISDQVHDVHEEMGDMLTRRMEVVGQNRKE